MDYGRTNKSCYRKHQYSGPRKSRKKVQAGLLRSREGNPKTRAEAWRDSSRDTVKIPREPVPTPKPLRTYSRIKAVVSVEADIPITSAETLAPQSDGSCLAGRKREQQAQNQSEEPGPSQGPPTGGGEGEGPEEVANVKVIIEEDKNQSEEPGPSQGPPTGGGEGEGTEEVANVKVIIEEDEPPSPKDAEQMDVQEEPAELEEGPPTPPSPPVLTLEQKTIQRLEKKVASLQARVQKLMKVNEDKNKMSTALRDARAKITELTAKNGALERQNMESQRKITVLERMNEELVQSNYEYSKKLAHYTDKNKVVKPPKKTILLDQPMPMSPPTSATDSRRNQGPSGKVAKKRPHPESQPSTLTDSPPMAPAEPYGVFELRSDPLPIKSEPDPLEDQPGVSTTFINPLGVSTTFIEPFEDSGTTSTTLTNPLGNSSTITNPLGSSSTITNPLGGSSTITNPLGNSSTITNPLGDSNTTYIDLLGDSSQFVSPLAAIPSSIGSGNERCTLYGETNNGLISVENIKIEEDMTIVEHNLEEEEMYTVIVTEVNN